MSSIIQQARVQRTMRVEEFIYIKQWCSP